MKVSDVKFVFFGSDTVAKSALAAMARFGLAPSETGDVAVLCEGEHLCATMRGVKTPSRMVSSVMRGVFREHAEVRAEFMSMVK